MDLSAAVLENAKGLLTKFGERARRLINDPKKVRQILDEARRKADDASTQELWLEYLLLMARLISAYLKGLYRNVSPETVFLIVASILYFLFPLDALPDPILIDDVAVLVFVATKVKDELDDFACWEDAHGLYVAKPIGFC